MIVTNNQNQETINTRHIESFSKCDYRFDYAGHLRNDKEKVYQLRFHMVSGNTFTWEFPTQEERDLFFDNLKGVAG
jgi:hypothetical protein